MDKSQVTVFIPTFNRLARLKKAVASVLSQGDFLRLHVLDNASTDGTAEWLRVLKDSDDRVQITLREKNLGGYRNFLEGFQAVETPYVVPLADDDLLCQGFLEKALCIADSDPSLGAVVFQTIGVSNGETIMVSPNDGVSGHLPIGAHLQAWARRGHYLSWSSILWSTKAVWSTNAHREMVRYGLPGDAWFQFRVFCAAPVHLVMEPGSQFNFHGSQAWRSIGPKTLRDFGAMATGMQRHLVANGIFDKNESRKAVANLCGHWCALIETICKTPSSAYGASDVIAGMLFYLWHMAPIVGLRNFPFKPIIEKYNAPTK